MSIPYLLVCPVGSIDLKSAWSESEYQNHWRTNTQSQYKILVYRYNPQFVLEKTEYHEIIDHIGLKFDHITHFLNNELDKYKDVRYIGFPDEDLYLSQQDLVNACEYAFERNIELFQISVDDNSRWHFGLFKHDSTIEYTINSGVEIMWPFMTYDIALKLRDYCNYVKPKHGWASDYIFEHTLGVKGYVLHNWKMIHPFAKQSYNTEEAHSEYVRVASVDAPKYLKEKFDIDYNFDGNWKTYSTKYKNGRIENNNIIYEGWPPINW